MVYAHCCQAMILRELLATPNGGISIEISTGLVGDASMMLGLLAFGSLYLPDQL